VSFQGRDRPGHSALRFSRAGLSGQGCCSALSLLAASGLEADAMPFRKLGQAALTRRLDVRVSPGAKMVMLSIAEAAGLSVAELVRRRVLGRPVVARTDATTIRELRRLGGLLKKVHVDSGGAYSAATADALVELTRAIAALVAGSSETNSPRSPR
jgi:hypothetical protein